MFWCDSCSPYSQGAALGKLAEIRTYGDAINYVIVCSFNRELDLHRLIRSIAIAKGAPEQIGETQAVAFFT